MDSRLIKYMQTGHILAAVASEGSFSKAAVLLGVHQTAISHRVKSLEAALGVQIFKRTTRQLTPTSAGKLLCDTAITSVNEMQKTYNHITGMQKDTSIRLSTVSSIAMKWFLALMPDAKAQNINISMHVQDTLVDLIAGEADVALRFGLGPYPGLHHTKLCTAAVQPVASPGYLAQNNIDPTALDNQKVHFMVDKVAEKQPLFFRWNAYFEAIGNQHQTIEGATHLDRTDLAIHAAINGLGIALGRSLLVEEDIASGFLVPVDKPMQIPSSYWLVCTHDFARTQKYKRLEKWIKEKIQLHSPL